MGTVVAGVLTSAITALDSPSLAAAVLTAAAVLCALLVTSRGAVLVSTPLPAVALRTCSAEAAYLRLNHPATPGRPRPRAPGQQP